MKTRPAHRFAIAALVALAALALLAPALPESRLSVATGSVETGRGEPPVWKAASAGEVLSPGDRIRTGRDGRAEVVLEGATLRVYPNSMLRLPEASSARSVEMKGGASLFDVLHTGEPFEVRTPEVVVSVKGTRFGVSIDGDDAAVSVFRGLVGVHGDAADATETLVQAGFAARGNDHFELSWHGSDDAWEAWGDGGSLPDPARHVRREAALRDAHQSAMDSARELPRSEMDGRGDRDGKPAKDAPPAALDPDLNGGVVRDVVADARGTLGDTLEENFVGDVVDGLTGGILTLEIPGPDIVNATVGGVTYTLRESDLLNPPQNFIDALVQNGVADTGAVINQVGRLLGN